MTKRSPIRGCVEDALAEFQALHATLRDYFDDFTSRILAEALQGDAREAEER